MSDDVLKQLAAINQTVKQVREDMERVLTQHRENLGTTTPVEQPAVAVEEEVIEPVPVMEPAIAQPQRQIPPFIKDNLGKKFPFEDNTPTLQRILKSIRDKKLPDSEDQIMRATNDADLTTAVNAYLKKLPDKKLGGRRTRKRRHTRRKKSKRGKRSFRR